MSLASVVPGLPGLPPDVLRLLLAAAVALTVATAVRGLQLATRPHDPKIGSRWRSLATWWILLGILAVVVALGRPALVVGMAVASLLLLREGLSLMEAGGWYLVAAALALLVYLWAWLDWRTLFFKVIPATVVATAGAELAWRALLRPRLARTRGVAAVLLVAVVGPSYVVAVGSGPSQAPASGWLVSLLLLTELNDIAQAWCGRLLGSHALAPRLSPAKTWEGLLGGLAVTALAAVLVLPLATGSGAGAAPAPARSGTPWWWAGCAGLVIALAGTAGDLTASALKRKAGVKDSGTLLPGHGGILDRFDSLALASPAFFAFIHLFRVSGP